MRRKRKNKMSTIQHQAAGQQLQDAYVNVLSLEGKMINVYGRGAEITRGMKKAKNALVRVKDIADDIYFKENSETQCSPYFGQNF
jgi:hypothetical protein